MKAQLDYESQMHAIPVRNEKVLVTPSDNDPEVLIAKVTLKYRGLLAVAKKLFNPRPYKRYELAGLTRELYERLDGKATVENLVDELAESEKLSFFEARAFILHYLNGLLQRGLIVIVAPRQEELVLGAGVEPAQPVKVTRPST